MTSVRARPPDAFRGSHWMFWAASGAALAAFRLLIGSERVVPVLVGFCAWTILGTTISHVLVRLGTRVRIVERAPLPMIGLGVIGVIFGTLVFAGCLTAIGAMGGNPVQARVVGSVVLFVGSVLTAWAAAALMVAQLRRAHDAERRSLLAEGDAIRARMQMLRLQLNPHFLFNALNSLSAVIDDDPSRAQRMLVDISKLLRNALAADEVEGTLGEELERLQTYLRIERVRFGDRLDVEIDIPADLHGVRCLPMLLQPLVENAVRHGHADALQLRLSAVRAAGEIVIRISNRVAPKSAPGAGIGLTNVRQRLHARYGDDHAVDVRHLDDTIEVELRWSVA